MHFAKKKKSEFQHLFLAFTTNETSEYHPYLLLCIVAGLCLPILNSLPTESKYFVSFVYTFPFLCKFVLASLNDIRNQSALPTERCGDNQQCYLLDMILLYGCHFWLAAGGEYSDAVGIDRPGATRASVILVQWGNNLYQDNFRSWRATADISVSSVALLANHLN